MELYREYFPTKAYKFAKMKMGTLLGAELDRLDGIAKSLGREYAVGPDNLASQIQKIREFTTKYHEAFSQYLGAVLVQHDKPVQCRPACGNCCPTAALSPKRERPPRMARSATPGLSTRLMERQTISMVLPPPAFLLVCRTICCLPSSTVR